MEGNFSYSASFDMGQASPIFLIIWLAIVVFYAFCSWKIFTKAGKPGWASLIPFYNFFVMLDIIGKPWYWFFFMMIPFVNFIMAILMVNELAKRFGKGVGFTLGLLFLGFIFVPILALGSSTYTAPQKA